MEAFEKERILSARSYFYQLFAKLLYHVPEEASFKAIVESEAIGHILADGDMPKEETAFFAALKEMRQYQAADWEALKQEYIRLFAGAAHIVVCPWESVYRSREHIIFDEHTLAVQEFYRRWGVAAKRRSEGPADHIGLECSFLSHLSAETAAAVSSGDHALAVDLLRAQRVFLTEHLGSFSREFCAALHEATERPLYRCLAVFLQGYIQADLAMVSDLLAIEGYGEE